ncbi:MAG: hypothetical protein ABH832_01600 [bacterium]
MRKVKKLDPRGFDWSKIGMSNADRLKRLDSFSNTCEKELLPTSG